jgi:uncharacterized protein YjeT (DUF2065 family)
MSIVLYALGLVCVVEGLAFALAPSRMEEVLRQIASLTRDQRRVIGLGVLALGVGLIGVARWIGG